MSRSFLSWPFGLVAVGILASISAADTDEGTEVLDAKEMAKVRFAASRAEPHQLARDKLDTVRGEFEARTKEFNNGRGTLDILQEVMQHLLESQLALNTDDADRVAIWERHWERTRVIEEINRERAEQGRIPTKMYLETRYDRLEAEIQLRRALAKIGPSGTLVGGGLVKVDPLHTKDLAKAKLAATQADPRVLAQEKVKLARWAHLSRYLEFHAGRGTLDILLRASHRVADAELAVRDNPADRVAVLEEHWEHTWWEETINAVRYAAGRVPLQDLAQTQQARFDAQIHWLQARARQANPRIGGVSVLDPQLWGDPLEWDQGNDPFAVKDLARAKCAAVQADPQNLARARVAAVRTEYRKRNKEFLNGRGVLDIVLEASEHLHQAEEAVTTDPADRRALLEQRWQRAWLAEAVSKARYDVQRCSLQDVLQPRYFRLQAEIALLAPQQK